MNMNMLHSSSISATSTTFSLSSFPHIKTNDIKNTKTNPFFSHSHVSTRFTASSAVAQDAISLQSSPSLQSQKLGVVVKPTDKPRLVLKFVWMEKNIGIALDQMVPGHGTVPLSPYYFWPRKDAWEELKELLESKPWISQKQMIILLNQATDIINLWQQSGGNLS
ncbi:small ribosomal subunit protein cS23-like [Cicer arietinum]|uniref:30S ribosomal protein 3, chloroplastic-like n=1 Tax=Cicer arietinum TaxID=3827 RepID=A0A1S2Z111_CICAR|nr:30S ribosomal protein 3, chloroplastic-like [Cicer arietinum]